MELTDELPPPVPLIPVPRVSPGAADDDDDNDKLLLLLFPDPTAREDIELVGKPDWELLGVFPRCFSDSPLKLSDWLKPEELTC